MQQFKKLTKKKNNSTFVIAGGVAANESIRENLIKVSKEMKFVPIFPNQKFCGDNAAMIAWAGIKRFNKNLINDFGCIIVFLTIIN